MGCCDRRFRALLKRNWIYRKRDWVSSLFQFFFPIATIGILVAIKYGVKDTDGFKQKTVEPKIRTNNDVVNMFGFQDFIDTVMENRTCIPNVDKGDGSRRVRNLKFSVSGIERNSWPVPFLKCDARRCTSLGMDASPVCEVNTLVIATANPSDSVSTQRVDSFYAYISGKYPDAVIPHPENGLNYPMVSKQHNGAMWTEDSVKSYVTSENYGTTGFPKVAVAVVLDGGSADEYGYQIRVNSTNFNVPEYERRPVSITHPDTKRTFDSFAKTPENVCEPKQGGGPDLGTREDECTAQYMYNGALPIQRLVDDWIIYDTGSSSTFKVAENGVSFVNFPTRKYVEDGFYKSIEPFAPLLLILGLMYPMSSAVRSIVSEKELRQKELMKMMSITEFTIGWSWFVSLWIFYDFIGIGCTIVTALLYENSSVPVLFFFWQISLLAVLMYAKVIAAVNVKSTRATLISVLLFFSGYFIVQTVKYDESSLGAIRGSSLHPVAAISFGIQMIGSLEDKGVGISRNTLRTTDNPSGYTMGDCFQSLLADVIIWGLFSGYLNRVVKGEYGQALPWNYCFTKKYWFGTADVDESAVEESDFNENIPMEPVSDVLKAQEEEGSCVAIRNLSKQFDTKTAVDGLNLTMYNGQITALLGHNGAGKTTTINMLTGMFAPTSGYAVINGKNIVKKMSDIRKNIGICLQHDCLFPMLTVKEHIEFFATVKGIYEEYTYDDAEEQINTAIEDVALSEKTNTYSKDLSGGMKRKLSVAIAFCGGSNVVFLDEPTSGMDPYSRRFTWNVIRQYRESRCIVLTTHFMDEADLLGDRIAIMAEGQLRCCGSSLFLKKKYGVGYQLTIEKLPRSVEAGDAKQIEDALQTIVKSNVADSTLLSNVGTEISFQLPIGASSQFSGIFDQLDEKIEKKEIVTYGVGITTLDEVFLMVARGETADKTESMKSSLKLGESSTPVIQSTYNSREEVSGSSLFSSHMKSLVMKRAMNFKRDKKAWCCSAILPVVLVFIGFLLVTLAIPGRNLQKIDLSLSEYNSGVGSDDTRNPIFYNNPGEFTCQPGSCLYSKNKYTDTDGKMKYLCGASAGINNSDATCSITQSDEIAGEFSGFGSYGVGKNFSDVATSSQYIFNNSELSKEEVLYGAVYFTHDNSSQVSTSGNQTYNELAQSNCQSRGGTNCDTYAGIGYVVSTNFTSLHSSILFQAIADEAIVREATGKPSFKIKPSIWPLPITDRENNFAKAENSFSAWFLMILSFPFITGAYATFVVTERMTKAKHLQTVAGVKPSAYWLSTYFWDILNYQIPLWLIIILMYITGVDAFTRKERDIPGSVVLLLIAFGPAAAGFTYCVSFLFKSPSAANLFVIVFNFFIGLAGPLVCFILRLIQTTNNRSGDGTNPQTLKNAAKMIEGICRFIPSFALAKGLFFTINIESFADFEEKPNLSAWSTEILLLEFIFLLLEGVAYVWLAVLIDRLSTKPKAVQMWKSFVSCITCRCFCGSKKTEVVAKKDVPLDEDVATEVERIQSGEGNNDLIVVNNLTKIYDGGKLAVDHLTFGIPAGECFGLLGINGAGKTSTMAMLTAEFPPTDGDASLASYSVTNQPEQTRRRIGYCPQFDAHFQNMTGREHVELYAAIKGVPREFVKEAAAAKLAEVGLNEFDSDRLSSGYSGGMKRKLSVACATIGNPQIVFLDEPSTGMDPVARRDLWKVISNMVVDEATGEEKNTSIILTTHSMEECEALCPRIGIMATGQLKCLGSAQQLKNRFGQGFQVEIKVLSPTIECEDFKETIQTISSSSSSEEGLNLEATQEAANNVSPDGYLVSLIEDDNPRGYLIKKSASTPAGISAKELSTFFVEELRVKKVQDHLESTYSDCVLRERQDTKVRYEVGSNELKIASLFSDIENSKADLNISDYGISQTSLEQVFNMHAAEAELAKQGTVDN